MTEQVRALVIDPDGNATTGKIKPSQIRFLIGGYLEIVTLRDCHLYCNEDGKRLGLPVNMAATMFARVLGWSAPDVLVGTVVFLGGGGPEEADIPPSVVLRWENLPNEIDALFADKED